MGYLPAVSKPNTSANDRPHTLLLQIGFDFSMVTQPIKTKRLPLRVRQGDQPRSKRTAKPYISAGGADGVAIGGLAPLPLRDFLPISAPPCFLLCFVFVLYIRGREKTHKTGLEAPPLLGLRLPWVRFLLLQICG